MTQLDNLLAGEFMFETILAAGVVGTGVVQGMKSLSEWPPSNGMAFTSFAIAGCLGIALFFRARTRNMKARDSANPQPLDAVLETLHAIVAEYSKVETREGMRICVFVRGLKENEAHQICNYVGYREGQGAGRDISCRCGVVGEAFRTGKAAYAKLPKGMGVVDFLVRQGFGREEAIRMRSDAKSWAAIPAGDPVVAVLFLDSNIPDFFGKVTGNKRKILEYATMGVAKFIARK
jgi:hypothetical protein